jgi:hypothetical protein
MFCFVISRSGECRVWSVVRPQLSHSPGPPTAERAPVTSPSAVARAATASAIRASLPDRVCPLDDGSAIAR